MRTAWRSALLLGLGLIALVLAAGPAPPRRAYAHAVLERSLPVQNQQLEELPELVETWYSEELERSLTSLEVLDTQGNPVHAGETQFSDDPFYAAIALPPDLAPGIYTLTYLNVSRVDGHTWSGSFSFIVLNPDGTVPEGQAFAASGIGGSVGFLPEHADSALRWLGLLATVALTGGSLFVLLIAWPAGRVLRAEDRRRVRETSMAVLTVVALPATVIVALSTLIQILLQAGRLGGVGHVDDILQTRAGELWLSRIGLSLALLLLFAPVAMSGGMRARRTAWAFAALGALGGLGVIITYSLASHAGAGGGAFWAVASDFAHFVGAAAWLGALPPLALVFWWTRTRLERTDRLLYLAAVMDRFSWFAVIAVALLIGTGIFSSFVQLPTFPSLWETTFGRVLMAKMALFLPLLGVAGINALFLKPVLVDAIESLHPERRETRPTGSRRGKLAAQLQRLEVLLPRTILAEILLGVAVLATVSVLAQATTAGGELRQAANETSDDFATVADADDLAVELTIDPFAVGVSTFTLNLTPRSGGELGDVQQVELRATFDNPNVSSVAGLGFTSLDLEAKEPGVFAAEAALLTQPGDWRLQARIRRRGMDDTVANLSAPDVGGFLARVDEPAGLFGLPFTYVGWNIVAGGALLTLGLGAFLIWRSRPPNWRSRVSTSVGASAAFAMAAGAVLVFGVHTHDSGAVVRTSPVPATAESLAIGQELFQANCVLCHGSQGRGDGPGAAALPVQPADLGLHVPYHNDGTFFLWISEGIPVQEEEKNMPAFKSLFTEEQRWHIVNFLRGAFDTGTFEPVVPEDPVSR